MFLLLRITFWFAIVVMLLPTNSQNRHQILYAVRAAVADISQFCDRNPSVCSESRAALGSFGEKAKSGAQLLMDTVRSSKDAPAAAPEYRPSSNTLRSEDLKPLWDLPDSA